jgi:hypothetical protein
MSEELSGVQSPFLEPRRQGTSPGPPSTVLPLMTIPVVSPYLFYERTGVIQKGLAFYATYTRQPKLYRKSETEKGAWNGRRPGVGTY